MYINYKNKACKSKVASGGNADPLGGRELWDAMVVGKTRPDPGDYQEEERMKPANNTEIYANAIM